MFLFFSLSSSPLVSRIWFLLLVKEKANFEIWGSEFVNALLSGTFFRLFINKGDVVCDMSKLFSALRDNCAEYSYSIESL